jgi:hypothetical protein
MRSRLISIAIGAWILTGPVPAFGDTVTLKPKIFPFSSFSLMTGMAFDGRSIWLADMGTQSAKRVVRLDANLAAAQFVRIDGNIDGLMLASDGNGEIYAANEQTIWQVSRASGAVKKIPSLGIGNCPQRYIAAARPFVWSLHSCQVKDSSSSVSGSLLLRIDPKTGERNAVPLGAGGDVGSRFLVAHGKVWVDGNSSTVVDPNTLATSTFRPDNTTSVGPSSANARSVYLAAQGTDKGGSDKESQFVVAIDPATLKETARVTLDDSIVNIVADDKNVVAFGQQQIYVLSPTNLELQRVIIPSPELVQFHASFVLIHNGDLLIGDDELGVNIPNRILLFHDWRPPAAQAPAPK